MHEYEAGITRTEFRGNNIYIMDLACEAIAREIVPGQFIQVRVGCGTDPFLRRTFSVCGTDAGHGKIKLMIDAVGPGTEMLCSMRRGNTVNIIGALGNGFDPGIGGNGSCVLVAGGVGAAPLTFLAEHLAKVSERPVHFLMGARNSEGLNVIYDLLSEDVNVMTATDDGSSGYHGFISGLLEENISSLKTKAVYACGPDTMMRAVSAVAKKAGIVCQVSLEERMACGIGACYGCTVHLCDGRMVRTCVDGPVFKADEVYG